MCVYAYLCIRALFWSKRVMHVCVFPPRDANVTFEMWANGCFIVLYFYFAEAVETTECSSRHLLCFNTNS